MQGSYPAKKQPDPKDPEAHTFVEISPESAVRVKRTKAVEEENQMAKM